MRAIIWEFRASGAQAAEGQCTLGEMPTIEASHVGLTDEAPRPLRRYCLIPLPVALNWQYSVCITHTSPTLLYRLRRLSTAACRPKVASALPGTHATNVEHVFFVPYACRFLFFCSSRAFRFLFRLSVFLARQSGRSVSVRRMRLLGLVPSHVGADF